MDSLPSPRRSWSSPREGAMSRPMDCCCNIEKIAAVHAYLIKHFPDFTLCDLHAPTRLTQAGLPLPQSEHHVVRISRDGLSPYYAVLLTEFQAYPVEEITLRMQQWDLATIVRANRIAIASRNGVSGL